MIEAGLRKLIIAPRDYALLAKYRMYPLVLPEDCCLPASTYQLIATRSLYALDGRINLTQVRIQYDVLAESYEDAKALMVAINDAIDNFSGDLPDGLRITGVQRVTASDRFESEARGYSRSADYYVQFSDSCYSTHPEALG